MCLRTKPAKDAMVSTPIQSQGSAPAHPEGMPARTPGRISDLTRDVHDYPVAQSAPCPSSLRANVLDLAVRTSQVSYAALERGGYETAIPVPAMDERTQSPAAMQLYIVPLIAIPGESTAPRSLLQRMDELKVPGASIAVIDEGQVTCEGYGDLDERTHPERLTQAASLTKIVTSLTVLSLIDRCRQAKASGEVLEGLTRPIELDTDVGEVLDKELWRKINPDGHKVTIAQLLSHTSGIPAGYSEYFNVEQIDRQFLIDIQELDKQFLLSSKKGFQRIQTEITELAALQKELAERTRPDLDRNISERQKSILTALKALSSEIPATEAASYNEAIGKLEESQGCRGKDMAAPLPTIDRLLAGDDPQLGAVRVKNKPGEQFEYSNPGYGVLQKVVETVTGKEFADVVQESVLDPLEMKHTTYSPPLEQAVQGHGGDGKSLPESWHTISIRGAGGLWTTARDFAQVILAIQDASRNHPLPGKRRPLISQDLARTMMSEQPGSRSWGLGLSIDKQAGYFVHDGIVAGFRNLIISDMKGRGVVVLTDGVNGEDLYSEILKSVAVAYEWPNRELISACKPRVAQEELYHSQTESAAEANKVLWKSRSGSYTYQDGEKAHRIDVAYDETTGRIALSMCEEDDPQKKRPLLFIPLGPSVAYHPADAQGWSDAVRFGEEGGILYLDIFGAKHKKL